MKMTGENDFIQTNIAGIIINIILTVLKFHIGFLTASPPIISDAFKNIVSILSSVMDVIAARMESISNPQNI